MKTQMIKISYLLRRELWENKGMVVWLPLIIAAFTLLQNTAGLLVFQEWGGDNFGAMVQWAETQQKLPVEQRDSTLRWGEMQVEVDDWEDLDALVWLGQPAKAMPILLHFNMLGMLALALFVAITYSLQTLNTDRKDRSILFWKSLPVSETTNVLCKLVFAILAIPLIALVCGFVLVLFTHPLLAYFYADIKSLTFFNVYGMANSLSLLWVNLGLVIGLAIKLAPFYAWLLFFSALVKRLAALWAFLVPLVLYIFEKLVIGTNVIGSSINTILSPASDHWIRPPESFVGGIIESISGYAPLSGLLATVFTIALLSAAVWLRNNRYEI